MKRVAFVLAILSLAAPALAERHRAAAGGDPDLDLTVRPRGDVRIVQAGADDNVYLPGLTEPAGARTAADMAEYRGRGGPIADGFYPPCSATVRDRCVQRSATRR